MSYRRERLCKNPKCDEGLPPGVGWALCPSCRYIGRWCFWLGALLAGAAAQLIRWRLAA